MGCMSCLRSEHHVADVLGVDRESLTGHWDIGHKLQLVYGDVLPKNKQFAADEKFVFDTMSEVKKYEDGMRFQELAEELLHPILTPQGRRQNTRWVRSVLRCFEVFLRDLPTIYNKLGKDELKAAQDRRLADQKIIIRKKEKLSDGNFIARVIGYCQIFNSYAEASMASQHVKNFPTTVLESVEKLGDVLQKQSQHFEFEQDDLFFAGIGNPSKLIENVGSGTFQPHVTEKAKQRRASRLNMERQHRREVVINISDNSELSELYDVIHWKHCSQYREVEADDIVVGEVSIEEFTDQDQTDVKEFLGNIYVQLKDNLDECLRASELIKVARNVLAGSYDWFELNLRLWESK